MRFKRVVSAHVEEREVDAQIICDGCGARLDAQPMFQADEVTIEARLGDVYPEGDLRKAYDMDCCGVCFVERMVPALAAAGFKVRERDIGNDSRVLVKE